MLRARFLRFLHIYWWSLRPWEWERGDCYAVTLGEWVVFFGFLTVPRRTRRVLCGCGREWR